ncbi:MAG: hypothetical protein LBP93_06700 [Treponema sp.]|jgi:hypothetical protein|nr:hypothetical protein [Treponema sp.]
MMGVAKFLVDRETSLRIDFDDPRESFLLRGKFIRSETVEGRKELVALAMLFDEAQIPMGYKMRINDYIGSIRAEPVPAVPAPAPAPANPQKDKGGGGQSGRQEKAGEETPPPAEPQGDEQKPAPEPAKND